MRSVIGIFVGAIVWMAGFVALIILLAKIWPDFALHARAWQDQGIFTFTAPMACFNLLFWALAALAAGWVAMKIARRREALWVLAGLIELYVVAIHIILFWPTFPWWYNLGVVIPAGPAILLGARLAGGSRSATKADAA